MTHVSHRALLTLGLFSLLPCLAVLLHVYLYGGNLPLQDQWDTPGRLFENHIYNDLRWEDFFVQHNEARKAFSNVIWFLMGVNGWDVRSEMYLSVLIIFVGVLLYRLISARIFPKSRSAPLLLATTASALLFNPYGFSQAWLWGVNLENAIMATLLLAGIGANLYLRDPVLRYFAIAATSVAATYTFANGMILWVLLYPQWFRSTRCDPRPVDRQTLWLNGVYVVMFVAVVLAFFNGYTKPPHHASLWDSVARPVQALHFFLAWLGAPLSPQLNGPMTATVIGAAVFSIWVYCATVLIRQGAWSRAFPWLAISVYTLVSGAAVTLGRSSLGVEGALAPRYLLHVSLFYLGLNGLLWLWTSAAPRRRDQLAARAVLFTTLLLELALVASQWYGGFERHIRYTYESTARGEAALQFVNLIPDNPDLVYLYPDPEQVVRRYEILTRYGILRHDTVPSSSQLEMADSSLELGGALSLSFDGDRLRIFGTLDDSRPVRSLTHLLGHTQIESEKKFFSVLPLRVFARAKERGGRYLDATVATGHLADGLHRIRLFGYDSMQRRLTPTSVATELRKGAFPREEIIKIGDVDLSPTAGGVSIDLVNGVHVANRTEITVPVGVPVFLAGWAVDLEARRLAERVYIKVGGLLFPAQYGQHRSDVARHFKRPEYGRSGFYSLLDPEILDDDSVKSISVVIRTRDGELRDDPRTLVIRFADR